MNTHSPLIPQGMIPDNRGKSHVRIAVFTILAVHVVLLGAVLLQGCKRTAEPQQPQMADVSTNYGTVAGDPNIYSPPATNADAGQLPPPAGTTSNPPANTTMDSSNAAPAPAPAGNTSGPGIAPGPGVPPAGNAETTDSGRPAVGTASEHTVAKGETFSTIAKKYKVTVAAIAAANPSVNSSRMKVGQRLVIPPPTMKETSAPAGNTAAPASGTAASNGAAGAKKTTYTVKSGDSLNKIATRHGVSLKELRAANRLKTDRITVGQKLVIPAKAAPAPAPAGAGSPTR